nr:MAG TPA: hypothetical protein [Caudoviricetes sp.]
MTAAFPYAKELFPGKTLHKGGKYTIISRGVQILNE